MRETIYIATRKSPLALWQANTTQSLLEKNGLKIDLFPLVTTGDKMQKSQLAQIHIEQNTSEEHQSTWNTGKGLFIKEVQEALFDNKAQIAVHSMKDLPIKQTLKLKTVSLLKRAGVRDVLILSKQVLAESGLENLSAKERQQLSFAELKNYLDKSETFQTKEIGTTSMRRQMLVRRNFNKNLNLQILRGNVDSRLNRLRNSEFAAIILAEAGLQRLNLINESDMFFLDPHVFIPATAQGVVAIETLENENEIIKNLLSFSCKETVLTAALERLVLFLLGGDCHSAIGVYRESNQIFVTCGREEIERTCVVSLENYDLNEIMELAKLTNFVYSDFFSKLCQSTVSKNILQQLKKNDFSAVADFNH